MSFEDLESGRPLPARGKQDPSQDVAAGIFQINTAVSTFQRLVNTLGTPKDTPELREKLHKTRQHIGQLVKETSAKLKAASGTNQHAEPNRKIADAKLAKDFEAILKEFQRSQRLAAERRTAYTPCSPQSVLSSREEFVLPDNEAMLTTEKEGIEEIRQQLGEVNEIYEDLGVVVHDQGVTTGNIGSRNEGYHASSKQVKTQLAKAAKDTKPNSSLVNHLLNTF
ncbi:Syntaxin [Nymphaea thermarum]|nr:Syntaxin [Nymphaea thermarum]